MSTHEPQGEIQETTWVGMACRITGWCAAAALAAIMSALVPNMTFGKAFKGLAGSTGLGSIFGEGGIIELVGTLKGFDLQMTSNRTKNFLRSGN